MYMHQFAPLTRVPVSVYLITVSNIAQLSQVKPTIAATWSLTRRRRMMPEFDVYIPRMLGVADYWSV
jgi:hypothetical protein